MGTVGVRGELYDVTGWPVGDVDALSADYIRWQEEKRGGALDAGEVWTIRDAFYSSAGLFGQSVTPYAPADPADVGAIGDMIRRNLGQSLDALKSAAQELPALAGNASTTTRYVAAAAIAVAIAYALGPVLRRL